jgi:phenylacetate-CoA ligase
VARLRSILEQQATVLCCTPTYAVHLGDVARAEGIDLAAGRVRRVIVAGEPGGSLEGTRQAITERWPGAKVSDHHGMTEVGPVSYECPVRPGVLHVIEDSYLVEIVDPCSGRPVGPGFEGELVLTTLGRTGSPLLRYRTGDLVRARTEAGRCECGAWDLALPGGILGRTDDMAVIRGVNVFPSAVEEVVRSVPGIAEYRAEVHSAGALLDLKILAELSMETGDAEAEAVVAVAKRLEEAFRTRLALRVTVEMVAAGTLPRFEMKARRWVRTA